MAKKYDNSGTLFRNDRREKDSHPNMTGSATIDGHDYFVNGWTKEAKNGKFISLSFKKKQPASEPPQTYAGSTRERPDDLNDDLPF